MTNDEILMTAEVLSREKDLSKAVIFEAIEAALATATKKREREDIEVRVSIDQTNGDFEAFRQWVTVRRGSGRSPVRQTGRPCPGGERSADRAWVEKSQPPSSGS